MLVIDSVAARCRYAFAFKEYDNWTVISDGSQADLQGQVILFAAKDEECVFIEYSYGSCAACDPFEARELTNEQICEEMAKWYTIRIPLRKFLDSQGDHRVRAIMDVLIREKLSQDGN